MNTCRRCGNEIPPSIVIDGIRYQLSGRSHCLECIPFKSGKRLRERNDGSKAMDRYCINCGRILGNKARMYCSQKCHSEYEYKEYIQRWKSGSEDGSKNGAWGGVSKYVRRYLFEKNGNKCSKCGWGEVNIYTGTIPLEIDHIDGDAMNNKEDNLELLCPNCHSLTPTYKGLNKGRSTRRVQVTLKNLCAGLAER